MINIEAGLEAARADLNLSSTEPPLEDDNAEPPPGIDKIAQGIDETSLHCYIPSGSDGDQILTLVTTTWDELFIHVGPALEARLGDGALRTRISSALHRILERQGNHSPPKQVMVDMEDFQRVKYQFWALGLMGRVDRWNDIQWTLTAYGRRYLVTILIELKNKMKPQA